MLAFALIEVVSSSLGIGLSDMVDNLIPEFDADIDIGADISGGGPESSLIKLLAWFRVGEVPVIMLFIVFLTGFGLSGLSIQFFLNQSFGMTLPAIIAVVPALMCAIPIVRICGRFLENYMPKDETYVVSEESFKGMVATITLGTAKPGSSAQAKLQDQHGQSHYLLVAPDNPEDCFAQGDKIIIVSQSGAQFKAIPATNKAMMSE